MSKKDASRRDRNRLPQQKKKEVKNKNVSKFSADSNDWLYGLHTVEAALKNPKRKIKRLMATKNAFHKLQEAISVHNVPHEIFQPRDMDKILGQDIVHQGVMLETSPLPFLDIEDLDGVSPVLILDQVTDPHNVGAIIRSAAAFDVKALMMTERHSPAFSGVLAKTASGGLEHVPICLVGNLSRSLETLVEKGYWRIGLDGEGETCLEDMQHDQPIALVLGAEGKGLRRLTKENCDVIARIKTGSDLASLNVSNAAAISLHSVYLNMKKP